MANVQITDDMEFESDPEMRSLAERVVAKFFDTFEHIDLSRVAFMHEVTGKEAKSGRGRVAAGVCIKVKSVFRDLLCEHEGEYDFIIAFFSEQTDGKSANWMQCLMYHELRHIGDDGKLVEHEIEDFRDTLRMAGIDWTRDWRVPDILSGDGGED